MKTAPKPAVKPASTPARKPSGKAAPVARNSTMEMKTHSEAPEPKNVIVLRACATFQTEVTESLTRVKELAGKEGVMIEQTDMEIAARVKQLGGNAAKWEEQYKGAFLFHHDKKGIFETGPAALEFVDNGKSSPQWKTEAHALKKSLCEKNAEIIALKKALAAAKGEKFEEPAPPLDTFYSEATYEAEVKGRYPFKSSPGVKYAVNEVAPVGS